MHYEFEVKSMENETAGNGLPIVVIELVVHLVYPNGTQVPYPMTVKHMDGMVLHDVNRLKKKNRAPVSNTIQVIQ